ncbi:MAG: TetR/AcrR family transcriptional regulator [Bacteroidia bacterium]|nr:TetR/AcrR family transcriptional regulator [Bacteroidia bacterium]
METYLRILHRADALFKKFGVRSVTMDDIAKDLGMSKKTIYLHYSNKAEMVRGIMIQHIEKEKREFAEIHGKSENAVEEMIRVMTWIAESFQDLNPSLIYDVKKYYPQVWKIFHEFKNGFLRQSIIQNLTWGIEQGLYRSNMELDIIAHLRLDEVEYFLDPGVFPDKNYDLTLIHVQLLEHYVHGLVTMKGKQLLNQYLNTDH